MELLQEWGTEILFGLISAIVIGYAKFKGDKLKKKLDEAERMAKEQEADNIDERIETYLEPLYQELEDLRAYVRENAALEKRQMTLIVSSWKFRLVQICKTILNQGYITMEQRVQLDEFYNLYTELGGNGQAKMYYEQCIQLPPKH